MLPSPSATTARPRVALVQWAPSDGISEAIGLELAGLGYHVSPFMAGAPLPPAELVLTFAPHGAWWPIAQQVGALPPGRRPTLIHWGTEGFPDPRTPWPLIAALGRARSWSDALAGSPAAWQRRLAHTPPLRAFNRRLFRFRYVGDNLRAFEHGWLTALADVSEWYARLYRAQGYPARFVPWGTAPTWHADLGLERDIDVLWMGKRRNDRRSDLIDRVRRELEAHGVKMYVADGVERPFIFGEERTRLLNRTKLTLNVRTRWFNSGFTFRFHTVAGNRCVVVSEPFLTHVSRYRAGEHYAEAPPEQLAEKILHLLAHEDERRAIAERAYQLVTTEMTLGESVKQLLALAPNP
jgi:hypothetical protein